MLKIKRVFFFTKTPKNELSVNFNFIFIHRSDLTIKLNYLFYTTN